MPTTELHTPTVAQSNTLQREATTKPTHDRWETLEFYRMSLVVGALGLAGTGGGVAAYWAISMPLWVLALTVMGAMTTLALVISVSPVKWITYAAATAVLIDISVVVSGILF